MTTRLRAGLPTQLGEIFRLDIPPWNMLNPATLLLAVDATIAMLRPRVGRVWTPGICARLGETLR